MCRDDSHISTYRHRRLKNSTGRRNRVKSDILTVFLLVSLNDFHLPARFASNLISKTFKIDSEWRRARKAMCRKLWNPSANRAESNRIVCSLGSVGVLFANLIPCNDRYGNHQRPSSEMLVSRLVCIVRSWANINEKVMFVRTCKKSTAKKSPGRISRCVCQHVELSLSTAFLVPYEWKCLIPASRGKFFRVPRSKWRVMLNGICSKSNGRMLL